MEPISDVISTETLDNIYATLPERQANLTYVDYDNYLNIKLDTATIGVTKNLLCGEVVNNNILLENEVVGKQVLTKEKAKPIIISVGHKLSLDTSVEIVKKCVRPLHKMPEPLHLAHRFVKKRMKNY